MHLSNKIHLLLQQVGYLSSMRWHLHCTSPHIRSSSWGWSHCIGQLSPWVLCKVRVQVYSLNCMYNRYNKHHHL